MSYELGAVECQNLAISSKREWMLADGRGGYAMGTPSGVNTRRYHGHWVPSVGGQLDRMALLANVEASVEFDDEPIDLSANQYVGAVHPVGFRRLTRFAVGRIAEWTYAVGPGAIRKRLILNPEGGVTVAYENRTPRRTQLTLHPLVSHRGYHENFHFDSAYPEMLEFDRYETRIGRKGVVLAIRHAEAQRFPFAGWYYRFELARELDRGLDPTLDLFCPCELRYELAPGETAYLTAGLNEAPAFYLDEVGEEEPWEAMSRLFLAQGRERSTIVAGYPWFTDWGRDTMIALPGICLESGRFDEARAILTDYASQMREGLIPNRFVEGGAEPDYNTCDATLWFVNACYRTLEADWNEDFAKRSLSWIADIVDWHRVGTQFGIRMDDDGLITQGGPGHQLTWMDAKIGDWVVTPRHGKPIEVNGLWINALRIGEWLAGRLGQDAHAYVELAERAEESFNRKFWSPHHGWFFDTVDPYDAQLRPNQVVAMALPFTPCRSDLAVRALEAVDHHLLTPYGLRTLGPDEIHYRGRFEGPLHELDAAYHQGTVWPWLLGSYVEAVLSFTGDVPRAERALSEAEHMLDHLAFGGVAETYDGDSPQNPGGCPWQAWSGAEIRRGQSILARAKSGTPA